MWVDLKRRSEMMFVANRAQSQLDRKLIFLGVDVRFLVEVIIDGIVVRWEELVWDLAELAIPEDEFRCLPIHQHRKKGGVRV